MVWFTGKPAHVYVNRRLREVIVTALVHRMVYGVDSAGQYYVWSPRELVAVPTTIVMDHRTYGGRVRVVA